MEKQEVLEEKVETAPEVRDWKPLDMTDELAARMAAGEMAAVAEFVERNGLFLSRWARKVIRNKTFYIPAGEYEADDCIDQIFVDYMYYDFSSVKKLLISVFRSFLYVARGGIRARHSHSVTVSTSLDAPISVSSRNGDKSEGDTLGEFLPSREPTPFEVVSRQEHIREIAPRFYQEIGRVFADGDGGEGGATIGELLTAQGGMSPFRDVIEEVFFGCTFEEVKAYAKQNN